TAHRHRMVASENQRVCAPFECGSDFFEKLLVHLGNHFSPLFPWNDRRRRNCQITRIDDLMTFDDQAFPQASIANRRRANIRPSLCLTEIKWNPDDLNATTSRARWWCRIA